MKNLLIYINPIDKKFSREHEELTKIQIDNSLELGWKPSDLILVTNFPYEYRDIKSITVGNHSVFDADRSTKVPALNELFQRNLIEDDLYWFHDHDAFELEKINLSLGKDAGFTTNGAAKPNVWNAGSWFFKKSAQDIFSWIWDSMNERKTNEQDALTHLWETNFNNINNRYEKISNAYNIGIYKIAETLEEAESKNPIVAHFHPHKKHHLELFRNYLPDRLLIIFKKYGIN